MLKIVLPTMAANKDSVETMLNLLERTAGKQGFEIGIEAKGTPEHFLEEIYLDQIRENITRLPKKVYRVVHGFSGMDVYENRMGDMRTDNGRRHLEILLTLGRDIRADYVHVHGCAGYRGEELSLEKKIEELHKIRRNMLKCKEGYDIKLGIENLPSPSMGDYASDSQDVWRDYAETLDDLYFIVEETDLWVTLDTAHYAANKTGKINLVEAAENIGDYLGYVHLNDVSGCWKPDRKSVWVEGVIPGYGNIGKDSFRDFIRYIKDNHPDIGICLEVYNADYTNPVESEESIRSLLKLLK